jgi:hypothetical protein
MLDVAGFRELGSKNGEPAAKREGVAHLRATIGLSERRAYTIISADRGRQTRGAPWASWAPILEEAKPNASWSVDFVHYRWPAASGSASLTPSMT